MLGLLAAVAIGQVMSSLRAFVVLTVSVVVLSVVLMVVVFLVAAWLTTGAHRGQIPRGMPSRPRSWGESSLPCSPSSAYISCV